MGSGMRERTAAKVARCVLGRGEGGNILPLFNYMTHLGVQEGLVSTTGLISQNPNSRIGKVDYSTFPIRLTVLLPTKRVRDS